MTTSLVLGIFVGMVLGLTGAGGGILAVPALITGMGWSMQQAAPVALIAVAGSAAIGSLEGFRRKLVRYRAAAWMAVVGVPFTAIGAAVARATSQRWLMGLFALIMLFVAFRFFRSGRSVEIDVDEASALRLGRLNPETGRFDWTWPTVILIGAIGATTGFMAGLLGVGGGFVIVPMLRRYTNVPIHGIVATSLFVISLVGIGGVVTALLHGVDLPMQICLLFTAATALGVAIGRYVSTYLPPHRVQQGFATVLVIVALGLILKATMNVR